MKLRDVWLLVFEIGIIAFLLPPIGLSHPYQFHGLIIAIIAFFGMIGGGS